MQLSIYDPPPEPVKLERAPPGPLETQIRNARLKTFKAVNSVDQEFRGLVNSWIGVEHRVEKTLKQVAPKKEETPLIPGALYALVCGMAGSIVARNRMLPIRILTPITATIAASAYFIPEVTKNVYHLMLEQEALYLPSVKDAQDKVVAESFTQLEGARQKVDKAAEQGVRAITKP